MKFIEPVSISTRKAQVAQCIREAIFSGRIALGSPLRELHLAKELGVSQPTVREALLELESAGFVVRKPNSGTAVTLLSMGEVRNRVELRLVLEQLAGEKAATLLSAKGMTDLQRRLAALSEAIDRNDYHQSAQADLSFHQVIWRASGNDILARTLEQTTGPLFAFMSVVRSRGVQNLRDAVLSHEPILKALKAKNPARAREALRVHIENSYEPYLNAGFENCMELVEAIGNKTVSLKMAKKA